MALIAVLVVGSLVAGLTACGNETAIEEVIPTQPAEQPQEQVTESTPEPIHKGTIAIEMRVGDAHTVTLESNQAPPL